MQLIGHSAVVTGGAQGIGLAIARRLLDEGASVLLVDLNGDGVEAAAQQLGAEAGASGRVAAFAGSVAEEADMEAALDAASERFGVPQIIANNAGWASMAPIVDLPVEDWDRIFAVCTKGVFLGTKVFARRAIAAGLPGAIVNTSSLNATAATEGLAAYCAAKAAVSQFTKVAALEFAPHGIRVNAVAPGLTRTPMSEGGFMDGRMGEEFVARTPLGRPGEPQDIANAVALLASADAGWVTGVTLNVDGGAHMRGLHNYWATMQAEPVA
ncbi:MAG TPA: glucose 1-dehydrogenase [Conexibacter sp.]|jgi:3-oxoacyl-[acyl-carrier protein] reductase|nr:glucose 1-dehydrogenase [Conexibacter sp.]